MTITELVEKNHAAMVEKGFHQEEKNIGEVLMLIVSELGEALDAHRKGWIFGLCDDPDIWRYFMSYAEGGAVFDEFFNDRVKDTFEDELADVVLRVADLCGMLDIDLETHIKAKMRYNASRPYKHGKAY